MSIKPDSWIRKMALEESMIEPFEEGLVSKGIVSYGVSAYGYDIRIADEFKVFTNINTSVVDPKSFDPNSFVDFKGDVCIIPPNSFALARSMEYFRIPRSTLVICVGKSTYARCGIITNVTPLEPEWEGHLTLEISIQRRSLPKSMPMRVLRNFCSSRATCHVKSPMPTVTASIRHKRG